jgi:hypothetical protein
MAFDYGVLESERHQLLLCYYLGTVEGGVEDGGCMALGENEAIVEKMLGIVEVEFEAILIEEQY